jgi:hypothetical protein
MYRLNPAASTIVGSETDGGNRIMTHNVYDNVGKYSLKRFYATGVKKVFGVFGDSSAVTKRLAEQLQDKVKDL